ncbi:MAG TPA: glycosyltransferase family 39 protein [Acetobacteraceae bacterium]|nr:glycosyltransferase family 39 protein [Acetobacteraceae bacterium]
MQNLTDAPPARVQPAPPAPVRDGATGRYLLWLILATTAIRLAFAASTGLGVDESYMISAGRVLSLGYFDHPPAAWWLSWGAAHLFGSEAPVVVRLPFIALFALSTWLMARLGAAVAGPRAGLWAAVLVNLSPVFGITTATWVLPDGPLDCALLGAALCMLHALPAGGRAAWGWWATAGLCAGLAMFSKYSAGLTVLGAGLYLLASAPHRHWLARPQPYLAGVVALLVFSPVLVWNATHHWASFAFQGDRAEGLRFHPFASFGVLAGEALFVLPWIWAPMMVAWIAALRRGSADWRRWLLCWLGMPPIVLFAAIAVWSSQRVLFHWAAPGYLMLFPLLGEAVALRIGHPVVRRILIGTAALAVGALVVIGTQLSLGWLEPVVMAFARHDPTVEGIDWSSVRADLAARGLLHSGTVVGVPNWRDAGKIAYALGPEVTVLCLNRDSRQFGFAHPAAAYLGHDVLVLAPEHRERVPAELGADFRALRRLPDAPITHAGDVLQWVGVYQGDDLRAAP